SNTIVFSATYYGTSVFGNDTLIGNPYGNVLARMDTSGTFIWTKKLLNMGLKAIDTNGYIYCDHAFSGLGIIDTFHVSSGVWIAKYNSTGNCQLVKKTFNYNAAISDFDAGLVKFVIKDNKIFGVGVCSVDSFIVDTITVHAHHSTGEYMVACFDTSA